MGGGLSDNNPLVVSAFHRTLLHQGLVIFVILAVLVVAWNILRAAQARPGSRLASVTPPEPAARRLLRISFGLLWLFDGILQGQASMPLGLVDQVVQPAADSSPAWVQHLVDSAARTWSYHPVSAAAASVWIQVGIGLWLLAVPHGTWSRVGGVVSAGWGVVVWIFGEAFGSVFGSGLSVLSGAPGAVLFYAVAGALVALPLSAWDAPRLGRALMRVVGMFLLGMAVLQAWPGRGFWQGQAHASATPGSLTATVQQMAGTPQPHFLSSLVSDFAAFDAAHGWGVNLFAVVCLAALGAAFSSADRRLAGMAAGAGVVLCLADWVFVEDLGFMGGVGTDPNSMIPLALILVAGWLAAYRLPVAAQAPLPGPEAVPAGWRQRLASEPAFALRAVVAVVAASVVLVGAAPMAVAAANRQADPILTTALNGPAAPVDIPATPFDLVDQNGHHVSLAGLAGKAVALTFLDPVCTNDCPVVAKEFVDADALLGSDRSKVELVALDANPDFLGTAYLRAFDAEENLAAYPNWEFLTGSLPQLRALWKAYGVEVALLDGGAMVDHSFVAYVIDPTGHSRSVINTNPGPATDATASSFSVTLADTLRAALHGQ